MLIYKIKKNQKGFTLIELVVTMVIISIITLLAAPQVLGYTAKTELVNIKHDVKVAEDKIDEVLVSNESLPNEWTTINTSTLENKKNEYKLYEKKGMATNIQTGEYKQVGNDFVKSQIGSNLKGTFYTNNEGKVYYEHTKQINIENPGNPEIPEEPETGQEYSYGPSDLSEGIFITGALFEIKNGDHLIIPSSIDGQKVVGIGERAFDNTYVEFSVTLPQTIEIIDDYSFQYSGITSINTSDNLIYLGFGAFDNCPYLGAIYLPNSLRFLGEGAFRNCTSLTSMEVPGEVVNIPYYTFSGCTSLKNIIIHEGILIIDTAAFAMCPIETIVIPEGVEYIGDYAFIYTTDLKNITLPQSLKTIREFAFYCTGLTSIDIPQNVETVGISAFCNYYEEDFPGTWDLAPLESVYFGGMNTAIENGAPIVNIETKIYGRTGSTIQTYAQNYGITFIALP